MPNWGGGNSKALEVRARRAAVKEEQQEKERKRVEDAKWRDEVTETRFSKKVNNNIHKETRHLHSSGGSSCKTAGKDAA